MKTYHNSPLLYEEGFSIIINEVATPIENSTFYTLTTINEVTLSTWISTFSQLLWTDDPLKPKGIPFVEGKRYDIIANDLVLLPPSVLHQSEYLPARPAIVSSLDLCCQNRWITGASGYKEILSVFNSSVPIFRFHKEEQNRLYQKLNEIVMIAKDTPNVNIRNLLIHTKFTEFLFLLYEMQG